MRKIGIFMLTAVVAVVLSGCGGAANNAPANNSNTNANKTAASAPTVDTLLALDKQANEAFLKGDGKFFEGFLSDKFATVAGGMRFDKAMTVEMISGNKCDVKTWSLDEAKIQMIDADTYALTYKGNFDGTCTSNGKTEKLPSPIRAATIWVRNGEKWQAVFHGENAIVDLKNPPAAPQKPDAGKDEPTKEAPKKEDAKAGDKMASNSNSAPAAPAATKSANTDALVAIEKSGWEAWKAKDAKKLDEVSAKNLVILTGDGNWMTRAEAIKYWLDMPCENVKTVDVKDGFGAALSPTAEMLTFKGWADGTCYGQKNGAQDGMSIYIKEGDAWKLAFGFSAALM